MESDMIPGSEFAPVVALNFYARSHMIEPTDEEMGAFRQKEAFLPGEPLQLRTGFDAVLYILPHAPTIRRLSCSDPDDMRAIWRRAALALGATEEEALHYVLAHHYDRYYRLTRPERWSEGNRNIGTEFWGDDIVQATAALCRAVWGPK